MLRTFAAALVVTALVTGTVFAAPPSDTAGAAPAAQTAPAATVKTGPTAKLARSAKHVRKSTHKRIAKAGKTHQAKLLKPDRNADGGRSRA